MASEQTEDPYRPSRRPSILVADDEPRLLRTLADLLRSRGFKVSEAQGGQEACEQLHRQTFDLALLDLNMPETDGFQVMAEIGRLQPDCGVIVVSGESSFSTVSRALRRGAQDYIRKPFDPDELLTTVEGVLGKQSLIRAHKMVQARLEKSEALHRYIVNSSPDIVFMLDEAGHICFINSKVESLLGYQPSELCGQHFRHILDDRDVARGTYALQGPNISADNPRVLEVRLKPRGSHKATRHFEITAFPVDPQAWPQTGKTLGGCTGQPARYYGHCARCYRAQRGRGFYQFPGISRPADPPAK